MINEEESNTVKQEERLAPNDEEELGALADCLAPETDQPVTEAAVRLPQLDTPWLRCLPQPVEPPRDGGQLLEPLSNGPPSRLSRQPTRDVLECWADTVPLPFSQVVY